MRDPEQQMMLRDQAHIKMVFDAGERYRNSDIDIASLERILSAVDSAMEGDVPKEVREAAYGLDAEIDSVRFTVSASEQPGRVEEVLQDFEEVVSRYG